MIRRLLVCLFVLSLLLLPVDLTAMRPSDIERVRPLQTYYTNDETGKAEPVTICTAWPARNAQNQPVWVTAGHCVAGRADSLFVEGKPARIETLYYDLEKAWDVATLSGGPLDIKPFPIALNDALQVFTPLWASGYPHGATDRHTVVGTYAGREEGLALYQLPVIGGMSGAPVLADDILVGMITQTECFPSSTWCPVARGVTLKTVRMALGF